MKEFKVGDRVKLRMDNGEIVFGTITRKDIDPGYYWAKWDDDGLEARARVEKLLLIKKGKEPKINFLLKYDLDTDPIEEFETMKEVQDRIKELVKTKSNLRKDSIVIYEVKAKKLVSVDTRISIKPAK